MGDDKIDYIQLEHRLTQVEQRSQSNTHRLDEAEAELKDIRDLVSSVRELAVEVKHMRENVNDTIGRLDKLEGKDGESWNKVKWIIITGIVTAVLGYFLGTLGLS